MSEVRDAVESDGGRIGAAGLIVTGAAAALAAAAAWRLESYLAAGVAAHLLASLPVWLGVLLTEDRRRRAFEEAREERRLEALAKAGGPGRGALFSAGGAAGVDAPGAEGALARLERFRRVGAAAIGGATAAAHLGLGWGLLRTFPRDKASADLGAAAALAAAAFALLLVGRYAFVLAGRARGIPEVAAGGRRATWGALATLLAAAGLALVQGGGVTRLDLGGHALAAASLLLGAEGLLLLLLEVYRPRRPDEVLRPVYDSRLLGLLTAPGDLARSIAQTVDYQFGFSLSQTWLYRLLARWVVPILGLAALVLWLLTVVVVTGPGEVTLVRRLGRLRPGVAHGPGPALKLPWPIDEAVAVPAGRVSDLVTGGHAEPPEHDEGARERAVLWTEVHAGEAGEDQDLLVLLARRVVREASETAPIGSDVAPVNLLKVAGLLTWQVGATPDARQAYATRVEDPAALLEVLAERELSFMLSGADLDELLLARADRGADLARRVGASAAKHGLGVEVRSASLAEVHPPSEVAASFEAATVAIEEREATIQAAKADAARIGPAARARAERIRGDAVVAARARVELVRADAERFQAQRLLDRAAPGVFRAHRLLDALIAAGKDKRKVVLGGAAPVDTDLSLTDKIAYDEQNIGTTAPPPAAGAGGAGR